MMVGHLFTLPQMEVIWKPERQMEVIWKPERQVEVIWEPERQMEVEFQMPMEAGTSNGSHLEAFHAFIGVCASQELSGMIINEASPEAM